MAISNFSVRILVLVMLVLVVIFTIPFDSELDEVKPSLILRVQLEHMIFSYSSSIMSFMLQL